jgi:hypothetical protein
LDPHLEDSLHSTAELAKRPVTKPVLTGAFSELHNEKRLQPTQHEDR